MISAEDRLKLLATDTKAAALVGLREDVCSELNEGAALDLATKLFDLLDAAVTSNAVSAKGTYKSRQLRRKSAADILGLSVESSTFKTAVRRFEHVLGTCRPDDYTLMPSDEDRAGVACVEAVIEGRLHLVIVRGPTWTARAEKEPDNLLRLVAEFRPVGQALSPKRHWNLRQSRNFSFTRRDDHLSALNSPILEVRAGPRIEVLFGLGGVGKSHICVEFAYRYRHQYDVVWWISGTDRITIQEDCRSLAIDLGIADPSMPMSDALANLRGWLETNSRWLLIVDNAAGPESVDLLLPQAGDGLILITSLNPTWRTVGRVHEILEPPAADAILFLETRCGLVEDGSAALAMELGYLPLALEHAAAYIDGSGISYTEYLKLFQRHRDRLLQVQGSHLSPIAVTWMLSIDRVREISPLAVELLSVASFMAPTSIPRALFKHWAHEQFGRDEIQLDSAIAALRRYSLINAKAMDVSVHRLLRDVVRASISPKRRRTLESTALSVVVQLFAEMAGSLAPHVAVVAAPQRLSRTTQAVSLLLHLGKYLELRGSFAEAVAVLEDARHRCEKHGAKTALWVGAVTLLAWSYFQCHRAHEALALIDYAVDFVGDIAVNDTNEFEIMVEFRNTSAVIVSAVTHDHELALDILKSALNECARTPISPVILTQIQANIGSSLGKLGRHQEGIEALRIAVTLARAVFGDSDLALANHLNSLGVALRDISDFDGARDAFFEAWQIEAAILGESHPSTLGKMSRIADIFLRVGESVRASDLYERAIAIATKADHHPAEIAHLYNGYALSLAEAKRYADSLEAMDSAIRLGRSGGCNHEVMTVFQESRDEIVRRIASCRSEADT